MNTNTNPHDLAASLYATIRSAPDTATLDDTLNRATHHWVAGTLETGTVEACAYLAADRARELQREYEATHGPIETLKSPKRATKAIQDVISEEEIDEMAQARHDFKVRKARYEAGMGRKGWIH